jgi:hypothetical protein
MSQTFEGSNKADHGLSMSLEGKSHSYDILGAGMLWKPKEARILKNFINQPVNIR